MTGGVFSFNEATADTADGSIGTVIAGLESSLADLGGFVAGVRSAWDGDEQELYSGVQAKWDSAAATVQEILTAVSKALSSTTAGVRDMRGQVRSVLSAH